MAVSEIKDKYGSPTALTITLANLASSIVGVGRQSTLVDNTTTRFSRLIVYVNIKQGTNPTGNKSVYIYLIRSDNDGTQHADDEAGASDAAITILNSQLIGVMRNKASPATGDVLKGSFVVDAPGPEWGIAIVHDTAVNLDNTGGNHWVRFIGINPEAQDL